jgi:hypothetical protein
MIDYVNPVHWTITGLMTSCRKRMTNETLHTYVEAETTCAACLLPHRVQKFRTILAADAAQRDA